MLPACRDTHANTVQTLTSSRNSLKNSSKLWRMIKNSDFQQCISLTSIWCLVHIVYLDNTERGNQFNGPENEHRRNKLAWSLWRTFKDSHNKHNSRPQPHRENVSYSPCLLDHRHPFGRNRIKGPLRRLARSAFTFPSFAITYGRLGLCDNVNLAPGLTNHRVGFQGKN